MDTLGKTILDQILRFVNGTGEYRHLALRPPTAASAEAGPSGSRSPGKGKAASTGLKGAAPVSAGDPPAAPARPLPAFRELPTGIICAGVNVPDHDTFFALLAERIRCERHHHLAVLRAADVGSSLKTVIASLNRQLVQGLGVAAPDEHPEDAVADGAGRIAFPKPSLRVRLGRGMPRPPSLYPPRRLTVGRPTSGARARERCTARAR